MTPQTHEITLRPTDGSPARKAMLDAKNYGLLKHALHAQAHGVPCSTPIRISTTDGEVLVIDTQATAGDRESLSGVVLR